MEKNAYEQVGGSVASEGPTMRQLVETKLEELRMVDGVTSALQYWRKARQPLNKSMINVRIAGRSQPVTVHCKMTTPNMLAAVHQAAEDVAKVLGSDAVAEGRRRAEAAREAAAPTAAPAASEETWPRGSSRAPFLLCRRGSNGQRPRLYMSGLGTFGLLKPLLTTGWRPLTSA